MPDKRVFTVEIIERDGELIVQARSGDRDPWQPAWYHIRIATPQGSVISADLNKPKRGTPDAG